MDPTFDTSELNDAHRTVSPISPFPKVRSIADGAKIACSVIVLTARLSSPRCSSALEQGGNVELHQSIRSPLRVASTHPARNTAARDPPKHRREMASVAIARARAARPGL